MTRGSLVRLKSDRRGAAAVEFAFAAPVLLIAMMGVFDLGYNMYVASLLQGAIQKAARASTIEGAASSTAQVDARVTAVVHDLAPHATLSFDRKAYAEYSDVNRPEDFNDINGNGICDSGEPFEDANGNGRWDVDRGSSGLGGARDAVLYEVTVSYPHIFPVAKLLGQSGNFEMRTQTILRNQPYDLTTKTVKTGNCL